MLAVAALLTGATATGAQPRFQGYVGGAVTGKGHFFVVGDGLEIVFRDRRHAGTAYRVCWNGPSHDRRCWNRRTGARGQISRIGTDALSMYFVMETSCMLTFPAPPPPPRGGATFDSPQLIASTVIHPT